MESPSYKDNGTDAPFSFGEESVVKYVGNDDGERDEVHVALFNTKSNRSSTRSPVVGTC